MSVAVIGAGIAGLTAAYRLSAAGEQVAVYEAAPRPGGKVAGGPFGFDVGAESLLARRPEATDLARSLGLADRLVHPTGAPSAIWSEGALHPIPRSVQGVPVSPESLTDLLSAAAVARVAAEPGSPAPPLDHDVAIGAYLAQRCGDEVVDRLLEPLLGGVYAGHSRELSFAAVNPALWDRVRTGGSLVEHAAALLPPPPTPETPARPVFAGLRGGVHTLVAALVDELSRRGVSLHRGCTVRRLARERAAYRLVTGPVPWPTDVRADRVVLAVPATPAARLLATLADTAEHPVRLAGAAEQLAAVRYASMAVVTLVVTEAGLTGSGVLVAPGELPTVKALTYSSNKWAWIAEAAAERWGPGTQVVRASIGRAGEERLLQLGDDELVTRTVAELRATLPGWTGVQVRAQHVQRWGGGLPQYAVGHLDRMRTVGDAVAAEPGLALCGAYLAGVGIPACMAAAERAAAAVSDGRVDEHLVEGQR